MYSKQEKKFQKEAGKVTEVVEAKKRKSGNHTSNSSARVRFSVLPNIKLTFHIQAKRQSSESDGQKFSLERLSRGARS